MDRVSAAASSRRRSGADGTASTNFEILTKDVDLAIEQGEALGVPMWVCQAARLVLKQGIYQGRAQQDMSRVVEIVEDGARKG